MNYLTLHCMKLLRLYANCHSFSTFPNEVLCAEVTTFYLIDQILFQTTNKYFIWYSLLLFLVLFGLHLVCLLLFGMLFGASVIR